MLDGWYCRTLANEQQSSQDANDPDDDLNDTASDDDSQDGTLPTIMPKIDYKAQFLGLKKNLKYLLYENEFFQDSLRSSQRRLLKVTKDRSFLLDRLLSYEKPEMTSSDSDETAESSDDEGKVEGSKKRKFDPNNTDSITRTPIPTKKKKGNPKTATQPQVVTQNSDSPMMSEDLGRHLQSRPSLMELVPERAPPTVPNEMFSNDPSLDSESNDQLIETSPNNLNEECLSVEMNIMQD